MISAFPRLLPVAIATTLLVAGCGGGDDTPVTAVSGSVVKGPVNGSNVCVFKTAATGKGEQLGCTTTNAAGAYSLSVSYVGDVVVEATGGTYVDEATNATRTLTDPMQVVLAINGGTTTGVVTPLTTAAYNLSRTGSGGLSSASFASSMSSVATQFQLTGVNLATTVPAVTGTTNAYGNILRAISQYIANGNTLASVLTLSSPNALQAGFATAYSRINSGTLAFTFNGATSTTTPSTGTGTTTPSTGTGTTTPSTGTGTTTPSTGTGTTTPSTGTGTTTPSNTGTKTLTVAVTVAGVTNTSTISNVAAPNTQAQFCDGLAADTTFRQVAASGGGTLTITSCSFDGTTGNIAATLAITGPVAITVPYTIRYTYQ